MEGPKVERIGDVRLINEIVEPWKKLSSFQKHHRVPQTASHADHQFLSELAHRQLDDDLQHHFASLRSHYGLKRREITVSGPLDGVGTIELPFFTYEISVRQAGHDPAMIVWRRTINEIIEPAQIFAPAFYSTFANTFSILEIRLHSKLDMETIVDQIEDADSDSVSVDYDKDLTWCEIRIPDTLEVVRLCEDAIRVFSEREITPWQLLKSFSLIQNRFMESLNCDDNPFLKAV